MGENKREIIKIINSLSGKYSAYDVFSDWVEMVALVIQNSLYLILNGIWQQREQKYMNIVSKYSPEEMQQMVKMNALLVQAFEEEMSDILGEIYMESGCGNKNTGQFFTPFHVSVLTAQLRIPDDISEENPFMVNEPSTGSGGMIIAAAKVLKERGLNYQRCMKVVAQDIDWKGVYMTYVQLSLLGIKATVVQGDTLSEPYVKGYPPERVFYTPAEMGVLL